MCPSTNTALQDHDGLKGSEIGRKEDLNSNFTWYDQRMLQLTKAFPFFFSFLLFIIIFLIQAFSFIHKNHTNR
jgi:hypothetical protein